MKLRRSLISLVMIVLCVVGSIAQKVESVSLRIGLIGINFDEKTVLRFYSTAYDTKPIKTLTFFQDDAINAVSIRALNRNKGG